MNAVSPEITVLAQGLSRNFGAHAAVNLIALELKRGEILGFLGPNGAGKTTTMQMLTGNLAPSAGTVSICGIDVSERPVAAKARIGYLPEHPPLYRELTAREYIDLAARLHRVPRAAVDDALERCGLTEVARRLIGALSKGYQQRVGIAQAIVHSPDVVILDEPTVGLDPNQIREIRALIRELGRSRSVILSTHILPEIESVCDRVQIMHRGSIVYSDSIAGLQQFQGGRMLLLGLRRPPAIEILRAIPGVTHVDRMDVVAQAGTVGTASTSGAAVILFRVGLAEGLDATETLARRALDEAWGLAQLAPAQTSLEEVFVQLTRQEAA